MQTHRTKMSEAPPPKQYYGDQGNIWYNLVRSHTKKNWHFSFSMINIDLALLQRHTQSHCFLIMLCNLGSNYYLQSAVTKQPQTTGGISQILEGKKREVPVKIFNWGCIFLPEKACRKVHTQAFVTWVWYRGGHLKTRRPFDVFWIWV